MSGNRKALRPDTAVIPAGDRAGREIYIHEMKACCKRSFKEAVVGRSGERRALSVECGECGREWRVTSSIDERVLDTFVIHGGPRVGGGYPAA